VKPLDLPEQVKEPRIDQAAALGEHAAWSAAAGILQTTSRTTNAHTHLGRPHLDGQFAEELAKPRIRHVVVHDEPAVDRVLPTIRVRDVVGVRVATEPVLRFEKDDLVCAA